jgi:hypothetical protein
MRKSLSNVIIIFTCTFLMMTACTLMVTDNKLIFGKWTGIEWLSEGEPSTYNPADATFTFSENGYYSFQYADNIEKGKFTFSNNQLFTTPEGGIRMMVKVIKLENDTLIFDMNRGGQAERLTLVKN